MAIKKLTVDGLRGFSKKTEINFAIPDGINSGSGLTILVGPNNSGKSTVIEAIHLLTNNVSVLSDEIKNKNQKGHLDLSIEYSNNNIRRIESNDKLGALLIKEQDGTECEYWQDNLHTFILSSKRNFSSTFGNNYNLDRDNYKGNISDMNYRNENNINNNFGGRIMKIVNNRGEFEKCLSKVLNPVPKWTIGALNNNQLYLELCFDNIKHSSNGAGDGYINIFNIIDALYDSCEDNIILIDEPEISLHPDLQKKLFDLFVEYSKDKQIIISTHSPYFMNWNLVLNDSKIIRFKKTGNEINIFEFKEKTKNKLKKLLKDFYKPQILSIASNEIFFLNDNVILTEGQEDVIGYKKLFEKYHFKTHASFFGWGVGGVLNFDIILNMVEDLGYEKVFVIADNDCKTEVEKTMKKYKKYEYYCIAADDIRNKERSESIKKLIKKIEDKPYENNIKHEIIDLIKEKFPEKKGLFKSLNDNEINEKYKSDIDNLLIKLKNYFNSDIKDNNVEKPIIQNNNKIEKRILAESMLEQWMISNDFNNYIKKKFDKFNFNNGGEGIISVKKVRNNKYIILVEKNENLIEDYEITILFTFLIDIKKKKIKLKNKKILKNTLPISLFEKIIKYISIIFIN